MCIEQCYIALHSLNIKLFLVHKLIQLITPQEKHQLLGYTHQTRELETNVKH